MPKKAVLLKSKVSFLNQICRLLSDQYQLIYTHSSNALLSKDIEVLHNLRTAFRKFQSLLKFIRPLIDQKEIIELDRKITLNTSKLGAVRDCDVWLSFLEDPEVSRNCIEDESWGKYLNYQKVISRRQHKVLNSLLADESYQSLLPAIKKFINDLPLQKLVSHTVSGDRFIAQQCLKKMKQIAESSESINFQSIDSVHKLRKLCRTGYYWSDYFSSDLGNGVTAFGKKLKKTSDSLGQFLDLQNATVKVQQSKVAAPDSLMRLIDQKKGTVMHEFTKRHRKLFTRKSIRSVSKTL